MEVCSLQPMAALRMFLLKVGGLHVPSLSLSLSLSLSIFDLHSAIIVDLLFPSPDIPSGCEIQQLLVDIDQANTEVGELSSHWRDLLNASLETAKKFEADQR